MKMSKTVQVMFFAVLASVSVPLSATAEYGYRYNGDDAGSSYDGWIKGRLSVGLSLSVTGLLDGSRDSSHTFLGNITELEVGKEFTVFPELKYDLDENFLLGLSYSYMRVGTYNWNNGLGDGHARMQGPMLRVEYKFPMYDGTFLPHVGLGLGFLFNDFIEDPNWRLGYHNYEDWAAHGFTSHSANGKFREIRIDDAIVPLLRVGAAYRPAPNLEFDLSFQMMYADPDCEFGYVNGRGIFGRQSSGDLEVSNYSVILTASYVL